MALGSKYPNITRGLSLINSSNDELAAYLANPKTVCTFFAPSNTAMTESIRRLGKYAGIAAQNESLQTATFNYHGELLQLSAHKSAAAESCNCVTFWIWRSCIPVGMPLKTFVGLQSTVLLMTKLLVAY
jgi:hypothetical protein